MYSDSQEKDLILLARINNGDERAKEEMIIKYAPMIAYICKNYYGGFLDYEDFKQEALIALLKAMEEYKPEEYNIKFSSFAYICITRKLFNVLRQINGNKHKPLNNALLFSWTVNNDESRTLLDLLTSNETDPEDIYQNQWAKLKINQVLKSHLSVLEYTVLNLILRGYSISEIADKIGIEPKSIDNARTRVKNKIGLIIKKYGSLLNPKVPKRVRKRKDLYVDVKVTG
ncbi:MAG TPA: sigma-70 family RNA polymerase sigma factor [Clostridia bacterium]|jgi:RNA polymerase sporulation-specific sigma factor|nr:sigma-70 family RNA polymerase sigma factor [Clostridia bacterium]